jgi:hypothetical protein
MLMKKLTWLVVPLAMFVIQLAAAQQSPTVDRPAEPNLVFDDDGGKVQIVPADLSATGEKKFHGGAVMKQVQQISIFLGSAWGNTPARARQVALADVIVNNNSPQTIELQKHSIKMLPAAPRAEDFSDLSKKPLNDLDIQRKLSEMLQSKAIPAPNASTVYVLYLSPGITSTLGGHKAGVDYAAYHNVVNLEVGEVRYVVVPFQENADSHRGAAARACAETALNPNGQGWF